LTREDSASYSHHRSYTPIHIQTFRDSFGNSPVELEDGTVLVESRVWPNNLIEELKEINETYRGRIEKK